MKNQTSSKAVILDVVRKIRGYMSAMDAAHLAAEAATQIDEQPIGPAAKELQTDILKLNTAVAKFLKTLESSRTYKDMLRSYNAEDIGEADE